MIKRLLAVASATILLATGAQAAVLDLTSSGAGYSGNSDTASIAGTTVTISAHSTRDRAPGTFGIFDPGSSSVIRQRSNGIGVRNGVGDSSQVDGSGFSDWLTFSFDTAVRLVEVSFGSFFSCCDVASISIDGGSFFNVGATPYSFGDVVANSFTVRAFGRYDDFVVSSITVAPIPLPASALLLIGGLAGFGVMRRRKIQQI